MKKYIIYLGLLIGGILLGYFFFGNISEENGKEEISEEHDHEDEIQMWTCSMHPQIMQSEPGDCPICGMDLIPADASNAGLELDQFKMTENAMALANIRTATVGEGGESGNKMVLSGKIVENKDRTATMPAHFDGRIEELYVTSLGEIVKKGEAIARVYSPELVKAQQELLTTYKMRSSQPQLYEAVRNKFKNWKIHGSQLDEVLETGQIKTEFAIYSHVTGVVTEISVKEGDHIMNGHPIFKVSDLSTVWAEFDAYEDQISSLEEGQEITITTNAYPNSEFEAEVSFIDPILNTSTRTVTVRAVLKNENNTLKPGMFVKGKFETRNESRKTSLTIPRSAVLWTGERSLVYVKTNPDEPVFEMREVKLGASMGDTYEVLSGLEGGEEIVANGTFTIDAAAQLQGKKSMMNRTAKKEEASKVKMQLPETFQKDFTTVLAAYFELKDAFVAANVEAARASAYKMLQEVEGLKIGNLGAMETTRLKKIKEMLKAISENTNIENQRDHFIVLSEKMIAFVSDMKTLGKPVYVQHCPMANNDKGADWLSTSSEIRNPYYGEAMLTCGEVIKTIK